MKLANPYPVQKVCFMGLFMGEDSGIRFRVGIQG
jgi:hypothetical protein